MTSSLGRVAMSLDGRIADAQGGLGWLQAFGGGEADDADCAASYAEVDAPVMGRETDAAVAAHPTWPSEGKPVPAVTTRPLEPARPLGLGPPPDVPALRRRIEAEGRDRVWIVGVGVRGAARSTRGRSQSRGSSSGPASSVAGRSSSATARVGGRRRPGAGSGPRGWWNSTIGSERGAGGDPRPAGGRARARAPLSEAAATARGRLR